MDEVQLGRSLNDERVLSWFLFVAETCVLNHVFSIATCTEDNSSHLDFLIKYGLENIS